ncbi:MAG: type II toxin-antitoxin system PemK/MazF family toxin [Candidatus Latescibacterota bacterium]
MPDPKRYEVYLADLNPTVGDEMRKVRPVVIVSRDEMNLHLGTVVVCPLTTRLHPKWRSRVRVVCEGRPAEVAVDQIRTVSKQRLRRRIDHLSDDQAARVRRLITELYGA